MADEQSSSLNTSIEIESPQIDVVTPTVGRNPQDQEYFDAARKQVEGKLITSHEAGVLRAYEERDSLPQQENTIPQETTDIDSSGREVPTRITAYDPNEEPTLPENITDPVTPQEPTLKQNKTNWKEHYGALAEMEEEKEKYQGWKEHYGSLADLEEQKTSPVENQADSLTTSTETLTPQEPGYKEKQEDIMRRIGSSLVRGDQEGAEDAREEYQKNVDEENQKLYKQHKTEAEGLTELQKQLDEEKNRLKVEIEKENEIDQSLYNSLRAQKHSLSGSSSTLEDAKRLSEEELPILEKIARKEMEEDFKNREEQKTEEEEGLDIELGEESLVGETPPPTNTEQEEASPETNRRRERWQKLYKIIGAVTKIATGVGGAMLGASAGALAAATSPVWLGIAGVAGIGLFFGGRKITDFALGRIFTQEKYRRLEQDLENATEESLKREIQEELERRRKLHENLRQYSSIALRSAGAGLVIGGITEFFATNSGGTLAGGEAVPGGETIPGAETIPGTETIPGAEVIPGGEGIATEILTPDTVNVYEFANGSDPSYVEYIQNLKSDGHLLGDNLLLTENLGSNIGQAQGELLKALHQQGIPTSQIDGKVFMDQVIELNRAMINNRPFDLQNMAQIIKNASVGGV